MMFTADTTHADRVRADSIRSDSLIMTRLLRSITHTLTLFLMTPQHCRIHSDITILTVVMLELQHWHAYCRHHDTDRVTSDTTGGGELAQLVRVCEM